MAIDNNQLLVSVIIPVYNVKPYLRQAIESVINQTYKNLEIIIVDDGSTDGSGRICDYYQRIDSRIMVIHQENRGLSGARNTGLDIAQGEYIAFLDPDDMMLPNMIEEMVRNISRFDADIAVCGYYVFDTRLKNRQIAKKEFTDHLKLLSPKSALNRLIDGRINIHVWNKIYRRTLFHNLRFPEGHVFEDQILVPYLFEQADRILLIEPPLIRYRKRCGSITTTHSYNIACDWFFAQKQKEEFVLKRTPKVFSSKQQQVFFEKQFCEIMRHYLALLTDVQVSFSVKEKYKKEIDFKAKTIGSYSVKTKILFYVFSINPYFCLCIKELYRIIKNLFTIIIKGFSHEQNPKH